MLFVGKILQPADELGVHAFLFSRRTRWVHIELKLPEASRRPLGRTPFKLSPTSTRVFVEGRFPCSPPLFPSYKTLEPQDRSLQKGNSGSRLTLVVLLVVV